MSPGGAEEQLFRDIADHVRAAGSLKAQRATLKRFADDLLEYVYAEHDRLKREEAAELAAARDTRQTILDIRHDERVRRTANHGRPGHTTTVRA